MPGTKLALLDAPACSGLCFRSKFCKLLLPFFSELLHGVFDAGPKSVPGAIRAQNNIRLHNTSTVADRQISRNQRLQRYSPDTVRVDVSFGSWLPGLVNGTRHTRH